MLSVYSPSHLQTPSSSFPFNSEMRSSVSVSASIPFMKDHEQDSTTPPSSSQTCIDWREPPSSSSSTVVSAYDDALPIKHEAIAGEDTKIEAMVPSQTQAAPLHPVYTTTFAAADYSSPKSVPSQIGSPSYISYAGAQPTFQTGIPTSVQDPLQSSEMDYSAQDMAASFAEDLSTAVSSISISQSTAHSWDPSKSSVQSIPPMGVIDATTPSLQLQPLGESLHQSVSISSPGQPQSQTAMENALLSSAHSGYYAQMPFTEVPSGVYPSTSQLISDPTKASAAPPAPPTIVRHASIAHPLISQNPHVNVSQGYGRRVTYPFVPSIDTTSGLLVNSLTSTDTSNSSPLIGSSNIGNGATFPHTTMVGGVNAIPVQGLIRSTPITGFMDTMTIRQQASLNAPPGTQMTMAAAATSSFQAPVLQQMPTQTLPGQPQSHSSTPSLLLNPQQQPSQANWLSDGTEMLINGEGPGGSKVYSFVPLSGVHTKKRPRRRFDEIERLYVCNWGDCEKSYGTLNHLNAHVTMQKHGPKRHPSEFKELRKAWRKQKKAEEEAAKQAALQQQQQQQHHHHQQQQQQQQHHHHQQHHQQQQQQQQVTHNQLQMCEPLLTNMHPHAVHGHLPVHVHAAHAPHPLAMPTITHHQPLQLPLPAAHPNQLPPHSLHNSQMSSQHHHPMGF